MTDDDDRFLSRWARLKQGEKARGADEALPEETKEVVAPPEEIDDEARAKVIAELPDIEAMDESSDFTAFLQAGVPEELRRRALRKLWRLNPVFANLDGLNDYDEDFTDAATVVQGLKTLYQVGKGMVTPEDEAAEAAKTAVAEGEEKAEDTAGDPEPDTATLCSPDPQETETAREEPVVAPPQPAAPPTAAPGTAAMRRWGRFASDS